MPQFPTDIEFEIVRLRPASNETGYLYSGNNIAPIGSAQVEIYRQNPYIHYEIVSEYYRFALVSSEEKAYGYRFEFCVEEPSVLRRKKAFIDILEIAKRDNLWLKLQNGQVVDIETHLKIEGSRWHEVRERLEFYIGCMNRLMEIEMFYSIIFTLPAKLSHDDISNLHTLSDSINHKSCITFPGLPCNDDNAEDFDLDENKDIRFKTPISKEIRLFGYTFSPNKYYFPAGHYSFDKKQQLYTNCSDGLGIGCEFTYSG